MAEQSQTTADTPSEQKLCKMGCGFFGNGTTGGCCSKCWSDMQKKAGNMPAPAPAPVVQAPPAIAEPIAPADPPTPMDVDDDIPTETAPTETKPAPAVTSSTAPKKKKKKASYKNMMKGMMQSNSPSKDIEAEKEALRKVTGGGTFTKIDKI